MKPTLSFSLLFLFSAGTAPAADHVWQVDDSAGAWGALG